jgi:hypothetical protein
VPRRRAVDGAVDVGSAPPELFDRGSKHWKTSGSLRSWLTYNGLHGRGRTSDGAACRRATAIEAWLRANGCAHERWPHAQLDWHKVAATGLDFGSWQSEAMNERLAQVELKES